MSGCAKFKLKTGDEEEIERWTFPGPLKCELVFYRNPYSDSKTYPLLVEVVSGKEKAVLEKMLRKVEGDPGKEYEIINREKEKFKEGFSKPLNDSNLHDPHDDPYKGL